MNRRYDTTAAGTSPATVRRTIPTRQRTLESDVFVPAMVGLALGVLAGILPAVICYMIFGAWFVPWVCFASIFGAIGLFWRLQVGDREIAAIEEVTANQMPAQSLEMPQLPAPQSPVLLNPYQGREVLAAEKRQEEQSDFARFVEGCAEDTTLRRWEPVIGRGQYQRYRDLLIDAGWADWRTDNTRDGWQLMAAPATICEALDA